MNSFGLNAMSYFTSFDQGRIRCSVILPKKKVRTNTLKILMIVEIDTGQLALVSYDDKDVRIIFGCEIQVVHRQMFLRI